MFKGKLRIWIIVFICCFCLQGVFTILPGFIDSLSYSEEVIVQSNLRTDNNFASSLADKNYGDSYIRFRDSGDFDIIFEDSNSTVKLGYTQYKNYFYTPMVLYVRAAVRNHIEGFTKISSDQYTPLSIDLVNLLEAMEAGRTWKDLGVNTSVVKEQVILTIPYSRSPYYAYVEELFYYALNDYAVPSEAKREILKTRVDALLDKCEKVEDIAQAIRDEYKSSSRNHKVFIGPEYLYVRSGDEMNSRYSDAYTIVYFPSTIFAYVDLFVKDYKDQEGVVPVGQNLKSEFENNSKFFSTLGYRVENMTYNVNKTYSYMKVSVK